MLEILIFENSAAEDYYSYVKIIICEVIRIWWTMSKIDLKIYEWLEFVDAILSILLHTKIVFEKAELFLTP